MKINFRREIKRLLKKRKLTVPDVARKIEIAPQTIYNYLHERTEITAGNLEKILQFLRK